MLSVETKRKIDNARDVLVGKIPNPQAQIEQITTALIYKFMDDMDEKSKTLGGKARFFVGDFEKYSWRKLLDPRIGGQERMNLYSEAVQSLSQNSALPQIFRDVFKDAFVPYRDPETLSLFLKEINWFDYHHSEELGNAYEYLLSVMSSQGDAGQFRTPRHIIDFIVEAVDPQKDETILDPACGTAGFLISAYKHIVGANDGLDDITGLPTNQEQRLKPEERAKMLKNFHGYDIDPGMVRLSLVNMYLHGFVAPNIEEYDSLTYEDRWNDDFDVILANPPFMTPKGGVRPHKRFQIQANRAEVLFVDYIAEHLKPKGRAGIVVPEGIIFQSGTAYKSLRKMLVEEQGLWAVVSLPAGVFQPYSGVKTSILLLDKDRAKHNEEILFIDIKHDGYSLGAQRSPIKNNDFLEALNVIKMFKAGEKVQTEIAHWVQKGAISETLDYSLTGSRHKIAHQMSSEHQLLPISEVAQVISGQSPKGEFYNSVGDGTPFYQGKTEFTNYYLGSPKKWTTQVTKEAIPNDIVMSVRAPVGPVNLVSQRICIGRGLASIRPNTDKVVTEYLFHILKAQQNRFKALSSGSTFEAINRKVIENFSIPIPSIEEQRIIAAELDSYQQIIDGARLVVKNWKPTIPANAEWKTKTIQDIAKDTKNAIKAGPFGSALKKEFYVDEGYKIYGQEQVIKQDAHYGDYYISEDRYKSLETCKVQAGDILISLVGTYGKLLIVPDDFEPGIINPRLVKITLDRNIINPLYFKYIFESELVQQQLENISYGGTMNILNATILKSLQLPIPPLTEQDKIVDEILLEENIVISNKLLIAKTNEKIKAKIDEVWGERSI